MIRTRRPKLSHEQMLASKPLRLIETDPEPAGEGAWRIAVPMRAAPWARLVLRTSPRIVKKFELDELGFFVWNACDGKTSVQQIIRGLGKQYNLNARAAEVATLAFLQTLAKKSLIGVSK
jgi:hypothetical protein